MTQALPRMQQTGQRIIPGPDIGTHGGMEGSQVTVECDKTRLRPRTEDVHQSRCIVGEGTAAHADPILGFGRVFGLGVFRAKVRMEKGGWKIGTRMERQR